VINTYGTAFEVTDHLCHQCTHLSVSQYFDGI